MDKIMRLRDVNRCLSVIEIPVRKGMYQAKNKTFVLEASEIDLRPGFPGPKLVLYNPKTDNRVRFNFVKADMDDSQEDTYGWRYESENREFKLLIIND